MVAIGIEGLFTRQVISVTETATLAEAARIMLTNEVSCLGVMGSGALVGLITERDMTRALRDGVDAGSTLVGRYTTTMLLTAEVTDSLSEVTQRMINNGVRHLPVAQDGKIVGMISLRDLLA